MKRFLEEKTAILVEIVKEITRGLPIDFKVCVVTESIKNNGLGVTDCHTVFPFESVIDVTWRDDRKAETYIETIIHELVHAYAHTMGFMRNTVAGDDVDDVDEMFAATSGGLANNLWNYRKTIGDLMEKFLEKPGVTK